MIVEVYEALRAIDVPDEQAKNAARALTADMTTEVAALRKDLNAEFAAVRGEMATLRKDMNTEFAAVRADTATLRKDMNTEFAAVRADIASIRAELLLVKWMLGTVLAFILAIAAKLFLA